MDIDILCKVIDNFGDIGVAFRLARSLSELPDPPRLRLVVDDLAAFAALEPAVDPDAACQSVRGWEVYRWGGEGEVAGANAEAAAAFRARRPSIVIECFACGRPDWLEAILFDPASDKGCLIIDFEHLSAEKYAEDFHRMLSLTRSSLVRKAMFLPGFAALTGGLIMDGSFERARTRASSDAGRRDMRRELLADIGPVSLAGSGDATIAGAEESFWICVFSYERDYSRVVADLAEYGLRSASGAGRPILVLVAAGKSSDCFLAAWSAAGESLPVIALPFLAQEHWDEIILASDFSIVRGEDSWARAALSGRPFLWQAYPQEDRHQMVKVAAFLDRLRPYFADSAEAFSALEALYLAFNDREGDGPDEAGPERLLPVLSRYSELLPAFQAFSAFLSRNADLASGLLTFLREIV